HTRFSRDWSSDVCSSDLGSPNPVSASTRVGRSVTRAICPARSATSVRVVSPMSGSPRSAESTAPDTYTPSNPLSWTRRADSGLNAPGRRSTSPEASDSRNARRLPPAVVRLNNIRYLLAPPPIVVGAVVPVGRRPWSVRSGRGGRSARRPPRWRSPVDVEEPAGGRGPLHQARAGGDGQFPDLGRGEL